MPFMKSAIQHQKNSNTTRHTLYFDNFFNNYEPLVKSSGWKMRAIGTIRPYRSNGADASERTATPRVASGFMSQLPDIRFDGVNHIIATGPQGRCQKCNV
ncbi:conserved hypothetical protein [Trichinella spiralis]|uniref:hypothetical protein n=1 Tax=Trichinella spiralis TaxID=6334 RepID=UPI0001EFD68C|nr:conserved hypothetical protein [Trichinella spiralis]